MSLVQVRLARDSLQTPWGFRLQGGKDLNQELTVQRVFANTPSERELQRGDVIVAINGRDTTNLTHKQAQDAISAGGGQIEFLVQRPLGPINIKPLTPAKDTRAPTFPQSPTRAPQINIPISKKSGPQSPSRIIPISPQKPSPPQPTSGRPVVQITKGTDHVDMASSGFSPKKVTLNKYGGGGFDFGSSYGTPKPAPSQGYRPVAAPAPSATPVAPPAVIPTSPPTRGTIEYQTQFSAPQKPISTQPSREESGVDAESLGGVGETRLNFMQRNQTSMHALGEDEHDYPTAPVWERRKLFGARGPPKQAAQRPRKPPSFGHQKPAQPAYASFGVDYTKPQPKPAPSKPTTTRERPPPVNRRDDEVDTGSAWSNTLRSEGRQLKPWEREALEAERYQSATADQPYRPHTQPPVSPKPKQVQISTPTSARPVENSAPPAGYRSVSPAVPPKPSRSPTYAPYQQQLCATNDEPTGVSGQDPSVVHLQYNSPIGLYSKDNIRDTYVGQTQGRALSPSQPQQQKKPVPPGERDWSDSYVYQMVHSSDKPRAQQSAHEGMATTHYPGQAQQGHHQPDYKFDASIGLSDF